MREIFKKWTQSPIDYVWNESSSVGGPSSEETFLPHVGLPGNTALLSKKKWKGGNILKIKIGKTFFFASALLGILVLRPDSAKAIEGMNSTNSTASIAEEFFQQDPFAGFLLAGLQSQMAKQPPVAPLLQPQAFPKTRHGLTCRAISQGASAMVSGLLVFDSLFAKKKTIGENRFQLNGSHFFQRRFYSYRIREKRGINRR